MNDGARTAVVWGSVFLITGLAVLIFANVAHLGESEPTADVASAHVPVAAQKRALAQWDDMCLGAIDAYSQYLDTGRASQLEEGDRHSRGCRMWAEQNASSLSSRGLQPCADAVLARPLIPERLRAAIVRGRSDVATGNIDDGYKAGAEIKAIGGSIDSWATQMKAACG